MTTVFKKTDNTGRFGARYADDRNDSIRALEDEKYDKAYGAIMNAKTYIEHRQALIDLLNWFLTNIPEIKILEILNDRSMV